MLCSLKNLNRNPKRDSTEDFSNVLLCAEMDKEVNKVGGEAINLEKIKDLLNKIRSARIVDAIKLSGSAFFEKYPTLRRTDMVY